MSLEPLSTPPEPLIQEPPVADIHSSQSSEDKTEEDPALALENILRNMAEGGAALIEYLGSRLGLAKLSFKGLIVELLLELFKFFVLGISLSLCIAFILYGISYGVGELFDGCQWLGFLLTGMAFFFVILFFFIVRQKRR